MNKHADTQVLGRTFPCKKRGEITNRDRSRATSSLLAVRLREAGSPAPRAPSSGTRQQACGGRAGSEEGEPGTCAGSSQGERLSCPLPTAGFAERFSDPVLRSQTATHQARIAENSPPRCHTDADGTARSVRISLPYFSSPSAEPWAKLAPTGRSGRCRGATGRSS